MKRAAFVCLLWLAGVSLAMIASLTASAHSPPHLAKGGARLTPLNFQAIAHWPFDNHHEAFAAFQVSCRTILEAPLRPALQAETTLRTLCEKARGLSLNKIEARRFFETHFKPFQVEPKSGTGFLTGYFEPEYEGSLQKNADYKVPLLARPLDLITLKAGETLPGLPDGLQAARKTPTSFVPFPDRAMIEQAPEDIAEPLVYLPDAAEAFILHVQGSGRIRLPNRRVLRVAYAGRNGHPYTSIGKILVEQGHIPLEDMSLERLIDWMQANPQEAQQLRERNRSYIFFRIADELTPEQGPIGGAGHPLIAGRSLAVDRTLWSYGLPFWLEGQLPLSTNHVEPLNRLMIAQDTGSAIIGPARGDFFFGSGKEAGTRAGLLRHPTRFIVLLPQP
jgi:membrane-bound lytic murein transglycosylase A